MNEESEPSEPAAKKQRVVRISKTEDDEEFTEDVSENNDQEFTIAQSKYDDLVTPEEVERLKEFKVLDEVKSDDENSDDNDDVSDNDSEGVPEDELDKMLEENLPDQFKGAPKPKEKPYVTLQKIILEDKGVNQFEVLPLDWVCVRHCSGMPLYLHRPTRVATLARPYALGKGNTKRHEIPISAIPCLSYRKALEEEAKQSEIDRIIEEQIRTGSWRDNLDSCSNQNNDNDKHVDQNNEINDQNKSVNDKILATESKSLENVEQNFNIIKTENSIDFDCDDSNTIRDYGKKIFGCNEFNSDKDLDETQDEIDMNIIIKKNKLTGSYDASFTEMAPNYDENSKSNVKLNGDNNTYVEADCDTINDIPKRCPFANKLRSTLNNTLETRKIEINYQQKTDPNLENTQTTHQNNIETLYNEKESQDELQTQQKSSVTDNNTLDLVSETPSTCNNDKNNLDAFDENVIPSANNLRTYPENSSSSNQIPGTSNAIPGTSYDNSIIPKEETSVFTEDSSISNETQVSNQDPKVTVRPIVLPGGIVMPPPRVENISTSWKTQHLTPEQVNDYCKRLFKFKTVKVMRFVRWPERRKYARARKALQAAPLPRGTTLITLPNNTQGRGRRDWVMNTQGCSYLSVFHEYVQRALQHQPRYEFQQLENASTPYQATVYIGGMQYGVGRGASKRAAKSAAARASMQVLVPGLGDWDGTRADLAFFEGVSVEDPRVGSLCAAACEPSPHAVLRTCLLRNLGAASLNTQMKKLEHQKIELTMTVGKHSATVVCKNKKTAKQRAAQAILQALHPHVKSWGSLLRLYGSRSGEGGGAARRKEARAVTSLQEHAKYNQPNLAVLNKLRDEMRRLSQRDTQLAPLRTMLLDHLPTGSSSELNNVDL